MGNQQINDKRIPVIDMIPHDKKGGLKIIEDIQINPCDLEASAYIGTDKNTQELVEKGMKTVTVLYSRCIRHDCNIQDYNLVKKPFASFPVPGSGFLYSKGPLMTSVSAY